MNRYLDQCIGCREDAARAALGRMAPQTLSDGHTYIRDKRTPWWHCDICHQSFADGDAMAEHVEDGRHYMAYASGGKYIAVGVEWSPIPVYKLTADLGDTDVVAIDGATAKRSAGQIRTRIGIATIMEEFGTL